MGDVDLILAGVAGGGDASASVAWFAPVGTPLPASASDDLDDAFLDAGWCSPEDGLTRGAAETAVDIHRLGSAQPVNHVITDVAVRFDLTLLETNDVTQAVYHRRPLGSVDADNTGSRVVAEGEPRRATYALVIEVVDGDNLLRGVAPMVRVTTRRDIAIKPTGAIAYGVTLTAYPTADADAVTWYTTQPALAA
ncbi:MAG: hypothetical protein EPO06_12070 [Burkholderiaceae bacterium]|nr:MAG: hypothetical protein EPO06_12070 [Burkholderiaceae bacterium]